MTCWSILCGAGHRRGPASESICVMYRKRFGRRRKRPILMMIRRGNSASDGRTSERNSSFQPADLATTRENGCKFLWRNYLELGIGAVDRLFVRSPSAEMRHMTEAASLHVLVS